MNRVILIGNVGKEPEIIAFENGNKLAKFSIATSETYKNASGEKVTDTQWHNITIWGKQAELIEKYVKSGNKIMIEGKIVNRSFETKEGEKRTKTEIVGERIEFLTKQNSDTQDNGLNNNDENLPF